MVGYQRQAAANMVTGATVTAVIFNSEFNQLAAAFDGASGHTHDGTSGNGPKLPLATSVTGTLPVSNGGTGGSTESTARASLGLEVGVDVQAYDSGLESISGLTVPTDSLVYTTAEDTYASTPVTSFARTVLDDTDASTARATLSAQEASGNLTDIANVTPSDKGILQYDGTDYVEEFILDYHQPTIINPTAGTVYKFIDYSVAPYTITKVLAITDSDTATLDIQINGVDQYTVDLTSSTSGVTKVQDIAVPLGASVDVAITGTTGSPTRLQVIMVYKSPTFSEA